MPKSFQIKFETERVKSLKNDPRDYIDQRFRQFASARRAIEGEWLLNLAFYLGHQYHTVIPNSMYVRETIPRNPRRQRITVNRIQPIIITRIAKTTKNPPIYRVIPSTIDRSDVQSARAAEKVLISEYSRLDLLMKDQELISNVNIFGDAYRFITWNPDEGEKMLETDEQGNPVLDKNGKPTVFTQGNVEVFDISPFDLFAPYRAKSIHESPDLIHASVKDEGWIEEHYPELLNKGKISQDAFSYNATSSYGGVLGTMIYDRLHLTRDKARAGIEGYVVLNYWIKPCDAYPNGRIITKIGGEIANDQEYPTDLPEGFSYPIIHYYDQFVPNRFYHTSMTSQLIQVQRHYNRSLSQIVEYINAFRGKYLVGSNQELKAVSLNDVDGEIIRLNDISQVRVLVPPPLSSVHTEILSVAADNLYEVSGLHDPSFARAPSNTPTASGLQMLTEQDESRLGPLIRHIEANKMREGKLILWYANKYWTTERKIVTVGKNGAVDVAMLAKSNLRNSIDVQVVPGSIFPLSKIAKQQQVMSLAQQNVFGDIQDPKTMKTVRRILFDLPVIEQAVEEERLDESRAERENVRLMDGEPVEVMRYDDHEIHYNVIRLLIISPEYEELTPQIQMAIKQHADQHLQAMAPPPPPQGAPPQGAPPSQRSVEQMMPQEENIAPQNEQALIENQMQQEQLLQQTRILEELKNAQMQGGLTNTSDMLEVGNEEL